MNNGHCTPARAVSIGSIAWTLISKLTPRPNGLSRSPVSQFRPAAALLQHDLRTVTIEVSEALVLSIEENHEAT